MHVLDWNKLPRQEHVYPTTKYESIQQHRTKLKKLIIYHNHYNSFGCLLLIDLSNGLQIVAIHCLATGYELLSQTLYCNSSNYATCHSYIGCDPLGTPSENYIIAPS